MCLSNLINADTIICPIQTDKIKIDESISYFIDTTEQLGIQGIRLQKNTFFQSKYKQIVKSRKRLKGTVWSKFYLKNTSNETLTYNIKVEDPYINRFHFYTFYNKDSFEIDKSGINYPFQIRETTYRNHISIIKIEPNSTIEIYLMADKYAKAIRFNVELWKPNKLLAELSQNNLITGVFYGILLLVLILTIIVYFQFKDIFLIGYILYIFGGLLYGLANSGLLFQYFLNDINPLILELIRPSCMFISYSGLILFVNLLFNRPIVFPKLNIVCYWFLWVYLGVFLIGNVFYLIVPKSEWIWFITLFSTSAALIGFVGIIISFLTVLFAFQQNRNAETASFVVVYFLLIFYSVFIMTNVYFIKTHSLPSIFVENVSLIFLLIETVFMSFAVTIRINKMIAKREERKIKIERQKLEVAQSVIQGAENERERIAKELHDSIGSYLSTIGIFTDQLNTEDHLKSKIRNLVNETHSEVRRISDDLLPMAFNRFGLIEAIRNLCADLNNHKIKVHFFTNIKLLELTNAEQLNIYRIIQELTNNTIKHANATKLDVQLLIDEKGLALMVEDNGKGFDLEKVKIRKTTAFHSIQSRCQTLNAHLHIESTDNGTIVIIEV
jgi:signal transduction histidine kinase